MSAAGGFLVLSVETLRAQLDLLSTMEATAGEEMFMHRPDRWWQARHWRCVNGHVSTSILKSEALRRDACLACRAEVMLTFPEDREGRFDPRRHPMVTL